ncbi:hypothetical protein ACWEU6_02735 [Streptosporangium sandarakinum]|uniref:hypothetical protein n=1 Tax=Streptosporangium sandarakinum TaxID=1260955 RepID=UPI0036829422
MWEALQRLAERLDPDDEFVLRELKGADHTAVVLARLAEDLVEAAYTPGGAYERLLELRARLSLTDLTADVVTANLQRLLVQLADPGGRLERQEHITVADPHARAGDLLTAVVRAADDPSAFKALAAEPDEWLVRLTRRRLLLSGVEEVHLDVQVGAELEERLADPDLIVTQLPYQAGEKRSRLSTLEGVEAVGDRLGPGRTAVVLGPADALVDALTDIEAARLRSELLRSGIVEAVVNLPGGVNPYRSGYRCALWILTRDPIRSARGFVLLADVSAEPLDERVCARLAEDVLIWRAEGHRQDGHDPRYGCVVPVAELDRRFRAPLTPPGPPESRLLARTVTERPALIAQAESELERAARRAREDADVHGPLRVGVVRRTGGEPAPVTVGALIAARRVALVKGHRIDLKHIIPDGHHDVLGREEIHDESPIGTRRIDRAVFAAYRQAAFTEPGDVVYTTAPRFGVLVDHDGLSVVMHPARVLRVIPGAARPFRPRVLAALLRAARHTARSPGATRPSHRIEDLTVPDLDPVDVERLDAFLADIERRRGLLASQDRTLAEIRRLTVEGFADGTLMIDLSG